MPTSAVALSARSLYQTQDMVSVAAFLPRRFFAGIDLARSASIHASNASAGCPPLISSVRAARQSAVRSPQDAIVTQHVAEVQQSLDDVLSDSPFPYCGRPYFNLRPKLK